ncbi:tetratricopeptide repeat protein [Gimesia panareensis]|uniref:tetratricopeptide repeat protein n=1 Tax=Gimesia panareensis TaxID=2527978 RepID=UPI001187FB2C|nr:tetratricopeptide repeat protein [Gimesia panareensis]QDU51559.1 Tetratricopeptide repeat protein [Gimesia panareensis]
MKRHFLIMILCVVCLSGYATYATAQDKIEVRPDHHVGQATLPCTILDFTQSEIKVKLLPSGTVRTYPGSEIVKVHTPQTESHQRGLEQMHQGEFAKATESFNEALNIETRAWVRREILAQMIKAALNQGDIVKAAIRFQSMVQHEPDARYFDLIPLDWSIKESLSPARSAARSWLTDQNEVRQLLGASILLTAPDYAAQSEAALRSLATSTNRNIQQLARAQLWRLRLREGDISLLELQRWERNLKLIPEHLRGGPCFLLGAGYALLDRHGEAAAWYLWVPLAYSANPLLSAEASLKAADSLRAMGQSANALRLYQETAARYPDIPTRQMAEQMINQLLQEAGQKN